MAIKKKTYKSLKLKVYELYCPYIKFDSIFKVT